MFLILERKLILLKFLWWNFMYYLGNRNKESLEDNTVFMEVAGNCLRGFETTFYLNSSPNTVGVMKQENIIWVEHLL